jgi:hypothetical protein
MQNSLIHANAETVTERLEMLQLSEQALREAIYQAHLQRARLTKNHPPTFPGLAMWGFAVGALGEQLSPMGWVRFDDGNYPLVVNEELGLAISVASGDEDTGNPYAHPTNRSKKGRNTVVAVESNLQADLFPETLQEQKDDASERDTWILLHYTDVLKKEIRMELSRPTHIGDDGRISVWTERVLLGGISFDDDLAEIVPLNGPDIDFEIRRKTS